MTANKVLDHAALSRLDQQALRKAVFDLEKCGERIHTEWILITGAPGSGKTTLINRLANLGCKTNQDPARELLEEDIITGSRVDITSTDYRRFQERVMKKMMDAMEAINPSLPVFFDYGLAESIAFLKASHLPWDNVFIESASKFKFRKVFLLEMLHLDPESQKDLIRVEDNLRRQHLQQLIGEVYEALGHQVIFVPQMPLQDRITIIGRK